MTGSPALIQVAGGVGGLVGLLALMAQEVVLTTTSLMKQMEDLTTNEVAVFIQS